MVQGKLPPNREVLDALAAAIVVRDEDAALDAADAEARGLLGRAWHRSKTQPAEVRRLVAWARRFRERALQATADLDDLGILERLGRLASEHHGRVAPDSAGGRQLRTYCDAAKELDAAREKLGALLDLELPNAALAEERARVSGWQADLPRLRYWCSLQDAIVESRSAGIAPLADAVLTGAVRGNEVRPVLDRAVFQWWWEDQLSGNSLLRDFKAADHEALIRRFQELDARSIELGRQVVRARLAARVPEATAPGDEMALLRRQLQLTRAHMPLRQLFARVSDVLRRLKPCAPMESAVGGPRSSPLV